MAVVVVVAAESIRSSLFNGKRAWFCSHSPMIRLFESVCPRAASPPAPAPDFSFLARRPSPLARPVGERSAAVRGQTSTARAAPRWAGSPARSSSRDRYTSRVPPQVARISRPEQIRAGFGLKELFAAVGLRKAALPATLQSHSSLGRWHLDRDAPDPTTCTPH